MLSSVVLAQSPQLLCSFAWDCKLYVPTLITICSDICGISSQTSLKAIEYSEPGKAKC